MKRLKVKSKDEIKWEFKSIHEAFKEANELRKILGRAEKWPAKKDLDIVQAHLEKRLARYHELNTPEMIEKRQIEAEKRKERERVLREKAASERITKFRDGENVRLYDLPFELLRIKGDTVETSRGAEVPLGDARRLYIAVKNGLDMKGKTIGHFTVINVYTHRNLDLTETKLVQIGCHKILLTEAERVLGAA